MVQLKHDFQGNHYDSYEKMRATMIAWYRNQVEDLYCDSFAKRFSGWWKCSALGEDYIDRTWL
jgi:hypothetical protein